MMIEKYSILLFFILATVIEAKIHPDIQYLYPIPGTDQHPQETNLIIRFQTIQPAQLTNLNSFIQMRGEKSGDISGNTIISSDQRTIIFDPSKPFIPGEKIQVHLAPSVAGLDHRNNNFHYDFMVSPSIDRTELLAQLRTAEEAKPREPTALLKPPAGYPAILNGVSVPTDFPWVDIYINDNPDTGKIFLCNYVGPRYAMILDNDGFPIWYLRASDRRRDFKVQKDGRLTMLGTGGFGGGSHIALDSTYSVVDTFYYPSGYRIDPHELQVLPNGHYFLIVYDPRYVDMSDSVAGGYPNAYVVGNSVAEMDANDNCIFFWRSWDHYDITDVIRQDLDSPYIEAVHMNAIEIDHDNNILLSSRFLNEISKVHRQTGEFIWRLGGKNDQFEWINDEKRISYQHDIRVVDNGNYTVFDNGNNRVPGISRALELQLDTLNMTVTKVWEYIDDPPSYSKYMGNVQRLPNGNTLVNWAVKDNPKLTEVRPDGSLAYEMDYVRGYDCYRTFRFPWKGKASVPYLVIESWDDRVSLLFNKFGDSDVSQYNVYGGLNPHPEQLIAQTSDPFIHLWNLINQETYYFRVTALSSTGEESGYSNEEAVYVNILEPEGNLIINGDFANGFMNWELKVDSVAAVAQWEIDMNEALHIQVVDGGIDFRDIQVYYPNLLLIEDRDYILEFDAYADEGRIIEADIRKLSSPYTNYSKIGYTMLNSSKEHFTYSFTMEEPTDFSAAVIFSTGNSEHDIYLDNISVRYLINDINISEHSQQLQFIVYDNYPNPFNPVTTINYQLPLSGDVELSIYNINGQKVTTLVKETQRLGAHQVKWDASEFASGIYFYRLEAGEYSDIKKMVLLK
jgi:hypothetical protein